MSHSFRSADRRTYRKVMLLGSLFCAAFIAVSFFLKDQAPATYVLKKADKQVRSAGTTPRAQ